LPKFRKTGETSGPELLKDTDSLVVNIKVNGHPYAVRVEPNWTLWEVLRDKLGIISPKDMCNGYGACGSCTVIMNGWPILSCMMLAIECEGAVIETAEGIADADHPIIEAYIHNFALQCGYCTPGFVVTAKALLDRNPNPTEADIRDALGGNLCKCSSYPAHIPAVLEAARELRKRNKKASVPLS
jgi:aerobic-type carbon monoxide dehydrogenase small subunit (CoxS/CutS family)